MNILARPLAALAIHLPIALLTVWLVWVTADDYRLVLGSDLVAELANDVAGLERRATQLRKAAVWTTAVLLAASAAMSAVWLLRTEQTPVHVPEDQIKGQGEWLAGVAMLVLIGAGAGWYFFVRAAIVFLMSGPGAWIAIGGMAVIGVALAYWLGTALPIKSEMRRSVPGAAPLFKLMRKPS